MRLDTGWARRLFGAARVARLATVDAQGWPHLVPMTFALIEPGPAEHDTEDGDTGRGGRGERVVSAVDTKPKSTTMLRRLRNIAANPRVSLLVDHYDDDWSRLWWVRVDGVATVLDSDPAAIAALSAKYHHYTREPPTGPVIHVQIRTWRGWAATPPPQPVPHRRR